MEQQEIILKQAEEIAQLKLQKLELEQKIKNNELEKKIHELEKEIHKLKKRRFLIESKDDDESVFQSRLIHLNYVTPERIKQMLDEKERTFIDPKSGKEFYDVEAREEWRAYKKILNVLGTMMSGAYNSNRGRRPNIADRPGRPNYYTERDFILFGDDLIHQYFQNMSFRDRIKNRVCKNIPDPPSKESDSEII